MAENQPIQLELFLQDRLGRPVRPRRDLGGVRFGRLVALQFLPGGSSGRGARWLCRCDCGNVKAVPTANLNGGITISCGCYHRERIVEAARKHNTRHGMWKTPTFRAWRNMKDRCHNPNAISYPRYGGRGLTVCGRWRGSFEAFLADMGERPSAGHSVDRKDNDIGYACGLCEECAREGWPANCWWATDKQQMRNRSVTHWLTFNGETKSLSEWAELLAVPFHRIERRLKHGWPVDLALTTPPGAKPPDLEERRGPIDPMVRLKNQARGAAKYAAKKGRITKPPHCQHPGCARTDIQAHHHRGYERRHWLDVVWLCRTHHRQAEG